MANQYIPNYPQQITPNFQAQQFFPQPQGNVYLINNSLEVANVPVGAGMSFAYCAAEGLLYIKAMQNGNPIFQTFSIVPYKGKSQTNEDPPAQNLDLEQRVSKLEALLKSKKEADSNDKSF